MNELSYYDATEDPDVAGFRRILATEPTHPYVAAWWPPGHIIGYEHSFTHTVHDFLRAVAAGGEVRPNFEDGWKNQRVLDAIETSANTGQWVKIG